MASLEEKLHEVLVTKAPVQIPEKGRKWIATYAWIFALVGLVIGVLAFFPLLAALGIVSTFGATYASGRMWAMAWLSLIAMAAYLVVLGIAVPKLKAKQAQGWSLIYFATLAYFAYDVAYAISYISAGAIMNLLWNMIWLVLSLYVIFQVRSQFKGSVKPGRKSAK